MRLLFDLDKKDYDPNGKAFVRDSSRCIIIKNGKIKMVHSLLYDYYKFPGGGIEEGETLQQAAIREAMEEAGVEVIPESVKEYGYVPRAHKSVSSGEEYFKQDNFYFLCDVTDKEVAQELDDYEAEEHFTAEWVEPQKVIETNLRPGHGPKQYTMLERESRVMKMLLDEGYFG